VNISQVTKVKPPVIDNRGHYYFVWCTCTFFSTQLFVNSFIEYVAD
jgi:hypothetical protein